MAHAPNRNILPGDTTVLGGRKLARTTPVVASRSIPTASPPRAPVSRNEAADAVANCPDILPPYGSKDPDFQLAHELTTQVRAVLSFVPIGLPVPEEKLIKLRRSLTRLSTRIVQLHGEDQERARILSEISTLLNELVKKVETNQVPTIDSMQSTLAEVEAKSRML